MRKFTQNQHICFAIVIFILLVRVTPCLAEFTIEDEKKWARNFMIK